MRELAVKPPIKHADVARLTRLNGRTPRLRSSRYQHVWLGCAGLGRREHVGEVSGGSRGLGKSQTFEPNPSHGLRKAQGRAPPGPRLVIPIALLPQTVVVGLYAWMQPSRNDRYQMPSRPARELQSGPNRTAVHNRGANVPTVPLSPTRRRSGQASKTRSGRTLFQQYMYSMCHRPFT